MFFFLDWHEICISFIHAAVAFSVKQEVFTRISTYLVHVENRMANTPHDTLLENVTHQLNRLKTFDCKQPAPENYEINIRNERCIVRAITVEAIDELFTDREQFENCLNEQNELVEPLLNCIDDRQLQFHGQLASLPKAQRRQRLVSSRAALYDNSHPS